MTLAILFLSYLVCSMYCYLMILVIAMKLVCDRVCVDTCKLHNIYCHTCTRPVIVMAEYFPMAYADPGSGGAPLKVTLSYVFTTFYCHIMFPLPPLKNPKNPKNPLRAPLKSSKGVCVLIGNSIFVFLFLLSQTKILGPYPHCMVLLFMTYSHGKIFSYRVFVVMSPTLHIAVEIHACTCNKVIENNIGVRIFFKFYD